MRMRNDKTEELEKLPLQQFLTYRLSRVQAKLNAQATRLLRNRAGLSLSQWRIIALIGSHGRARSSDLTRIAAFDKGLFSRKLKTLIDDGLVKATPDDEDHRVQFLSLSARGLNVYNSVLPHMRARQTALRNALSKTEEKILLKALDKLEVAAEAQEFAG